MVVDMCINAGPKWQTDTVFMMPKLSVNQRTACFIHRRKNTTFKCAVDRTSDKIE